MNNPHEDKAKAELVRESAAKWLFDMRALLVVVHNPILADALEWCVDKTQELISVADGLQSKADRELSETASRYDKAMSTCGVAKR